MAARRDNTAAPKPIYVQTTRVYPEIQHALDSGYTTVSEQGGARSSKTYNTVIWLVDYCRHHPRTKVSIVRKTLPALRGSVLQDFLEIIDKFGLWDKKRFNKSELVFTFPNGSWIEFFSCDNEQKLRGRKRDILYVNEANELTEVEWKQLKMRTTTFSIVDYNPSFDEDHWLCSLSNDPRTYFFRTTYLDNPFLPQTIIDEIESYKTQNPNLWRVYGLGLQAIIEGLIFPECDQVDVIPAEALKHKFRAIDFGYEHDPTAIEDVYFSGRDVYIDQLCYNTHMLTSDIVRVFKENDPSVKCISESADPRLVQEIYRAGVNIHPVVKYPGSVQAGIQTMQSYRFHFTKRSPDCWKEARNYVWSQDKDGKWLNVPVDAFNHCFIADTMIQTNNGAKRIVDIAPGDMVLTSKGYRQVINNHDNGLKKVFDYKLLFGNFEMRLVCTPDHKVKTKEGWKQIQNLKPGDVLYVLPEKLNARTESCSTEKHSSCIKVSDTTPKVTADSMSLCGSSITDQYPLGVKSTTKTLIRSTTTYPTSNASQQVRIKRHTGNVIGHAGDSPIKLNTSQEFERKHPNGTEARPGEFGIPNTDTVSQALSSQFSTFVSVADQNSYQKKETQGSARTIASPNGAESMESIMRQEPASTAEKSLSAINTQGYPSVVEAALSSISVVPRPGPAKERVYDLTVDEVHEFIANGVVVHNCWDGIRYVFLQEVMGGVPRPLNLSRLAGAAGR